METLIIHEVSHEGLEALSLWAHVFEVIKGMKDNLMPSLH